MAGRATPRRTAPFERRARPRRDRAWLQAAGTRRRLSHDVLALFGPTASGKTAVARLLSRAPRRRGRLGRLRGALRGAAGDHRRSRLPGAARRRRPARRRGLGRRVPAPRARGDRRDRSPRPTRSSWAAPGSTCARRCRRSSCRRRRQPGPARALERRCTTRSAPTAAHALLAARDPAAAARVHANDRQRRRPRARAGRGRRTRSRPARTGSGPRTRGIPTLLVGARRSPLDDARRAHRGAGRARWSRQAPSTRRGGLGGTALGDGAQGARARGVRDAARERGGRGGRAATRRLARYQRKWLRRLPGVATLDCGPSTRGDRR